MEKYEGSIKVEFEDIPPVRLKTMKSEDGSSRLQRLSLATKRRIFTLYNDWLVKVEDIYYEPRLNGNIKIPHVDKNEDEIVFDGASIPLPWLVSLLTIGILRPLGVMLIASIVHDYAYKYGHLQKEDGSSIIIERHIADRLFRDIIGTVNGLPVIGYIAWFFVRIGWLKVKYNNKPQGGKKPIVEYLLLILVVLLFIIIGMQYSFSIIIFWFVVLYVAFYIFSIVIS